MGFFFVFRRVEYVFEGVNEVEFRVIVSRCVSLNEKVCKFFIFWL